MPTLHSLVTFNEMKFKRVNEPEQITVKTERVVNELAVATVSQTWNSQVLMKNTAAPLPPCTWIESQEEGAKRTPIAALNIKIPK